MTTDYKFFHGLAYFECLTLAYTSPHFRLGAAASTWCSDEQGTASMQIYLYCALQRLRIRRQCRFYVYWLQRFLNILYASTFYNVIQPFNILLYFTVTFWYFSPHYFNFPRVCVKGYILTFAYIHLTFNFFSLTWE